MIFETSACLVCGKFSDEDTCQSDWEWDPCVFDPSVEINSFTTWGYDKGNGFITAPRRDVLFINWIPG